MRAWNSGVAADGNSAVWGSEPGLGPERRRARCGRRAGAAPGAPRSVVVAGAAEGARAVVAGAAGARAADVGGRLDAAAAGAGSRPEPPQALRQRTVTAASARRRTAPPRLEQRRRPRRVQAEVLEGTPGGLAPAGRARDQALLEEVGLVDVLDRVGLLPHRRGQRGEADRAARELHADVAQDLPDQ